MIISIINEKGGSGKSTIIYNLAINYAINHLKEKILLIDADPQKTIINYNFLRLESSKNKVIDISYKVSNELKNFLESKKELKNYNHIFIDTGGRDSKEMRIAFALSDIIIIPVIPSQTDIFTFEKMINLANLAKEMNKNLKVFILISRASPNPFLKNKIDELKKFIDENTQDFIKLLNVIIYEREIYKNSVSEGLAVTELKKDEKAQEEIKKLTFELIEEIKIKGKIYG